MGEVKNVLLVGVGGQGTILAAKLLTLGLMQAGFDVKMSEIHGMSQRGGSVSSQVRYGEKVLSPVIERGGAELLVSFEKMEALRWLDYLKIDGKVVVNDHEIPSMPVLSGAAEYPKGILEALCDKADTLVLDAAGEAAALGSAKAMNMVLLGAAIQLLGLETIDWEAIVRENVKPQFVALNLAAFKKGGALAGTK